jgi:hypothetical protein
MMVKEIAKVTGKTERSVQLWIEKVLQRKNFGVDRKNVDVESIEEKRGNKDPHHPADYTPQETLLIIEVGLGKNAVGVFQANLSMAAELADAKERFDKSVSVVEGLRVDFRKFLENGSQKALPDPNEAAYRELTDFIRENLTVTGRHTQDFVDVKTLYDMYRGMLIMFCRNGPLCTRYFWTIPPSVKMLGVTLTSLPDATTGVSANGREEASLLLHRLGLRLPSGRPVPRRIAVRR